MPSETVPTVEDIEEAISAWEEAVEWIVKGWDCIEEYTHDASYREDLEILVTSFERDNALPHELTSRIRAADAKFKKATIESKLCVWHCGPQFAACPNGSVDLCFKEYSPIFQWYFFRWQPDCPYSFREHDSISYQKKYYGMDFGGAMTEDELKEVARKLSKKWIAQLEDSKKLAQATGKFSGTWPRNDE
jgi:hypothetical protein